jgi:hypothetical protein
MKKTTKELEEEVKLLDTMMSSLVDILEEKGILTQAEFEKRVKDTIKV